jgi:tight adherence protein C
MTTLQILFLALLFIAVVAVVIYAGALVTPSAARSRLQSLAPGGIVRTTSPVATPWRVQLTKMGERLAKLSKPDQEVDHSAIHLRFLNAGLRSRSAPGAYFASKTTLAVVLPLLTYVLLRASGSAFGLPSTMFLLLLVTAIGYYLPNVVLSRMVENRKREIFESFPDTLDLTLVCVEAGLGLEAALARVAGEIELRSPILADELHLLGIELRAGSDRARALRNLSLRTGVEEVDSWATLLIQADRFGTSVGGSLRVQSETLRVRRRQLAQEAAAKISLKLLFPLIFCIFPALLTVLLGPAFIQIYRSLLPTVGAMGG